MRKSIAGTHSFQRFCQQWFASIVAMEFLRVILDAVCDFSQFTDGTLLEIDYYSRTDKIRDPSGNFVALRVANQGSLLKMEYSDKRWVIENFFRELSIMVKTEHPCIAPLLGWSVFEGMAPALCFVIPFYEHRTLRDH
jgi:hypothetical protein